MMPSSDIPRDCYHCRVTRCPNCRDDMTPRTVPGYGSARDIEIEACACCNLFWFDRYENVRLTRQAVLDLFRYVGAAAAGPRTALASSFRCPRCSVALAFSHDLQRTTRFTYWRCPRDQGQLISFQQFLRAKNFIRTPSPAELARLRETVRQISCSQCGAPIDLARDPACTHCGAPIALIDPDGVAKALQDLGATGAAAADAERDAVRSGLTDAQIDAIFELQRERAGAPEPDVLAVGIAAVGAWLARRFG
jgi:hypothetical protein